MACAFVLGACSDSAKDLPSGWDGAAPAKNLVQEMCSSSMEDFAKEQASFTGGTGNIGVDYQYAHFRCLQDVEGFFKASDGAVDILVQPIDMHPASVAACDCAYNITFLVEPLSAGTLQTTLYRRWDGQNSQNDPVPIASAPVVVQR